jgi:putative sugar O-methyltransferase
MNVRRLFADGVSLAIDYSLRFFSPALHRYVVETMFSRFKNDLENEPTKGDLDIEMMTPSYVAPDASDRKMVERIFNAFRLAKQDQKEKDVIFMPSTYWQSQLNSSYPINLDTNIDQFHFFLANFGASNSILGITWTYLLSQHMTPKARKYFENSVFRRKVGWWLKFESRGRDLTNLSQPQYGNLWGARVNGNFITYESVLNEFYGQTISNFIRKDRPIVGEIGAGYGVLFYFISRKLSDFCYLDFDLPETLTCATYYLMKSFPKKAFLLYGEGKLSETALKKYDFIFMPSYTIRDLPTDSVDIFINMSSLGEMKPETCRMFVREICRTAQAFWHMNHENLRIKYGDGTESLVNLEYPISEKKFNLIIRYVDALNAAWQGAFEPGYDIYGYYYKRK